MKSISELTEFYYHNLYPVLVELDKKRESIKFRIILAVCGIGLFDFIFLTYMNDEIYWLIVVNIIILSIIYKYLTRDYKQEFKDSVIAPLVVEIDKNLSYMKNAYIDKKSFERSKIFTLPPDKLSGNDYIHGTIDGVKIEFSDIYAQKKETNSKGETNWKTIFQGLFIVSQFNKNFKAETVVLPDGAQSSFGSLIGGWLQAHNMNRDELVKMDSIEFEKQFVVYSSDQIEARYILTNSLMDRLLTFQRKSKHRLSVSFVNSQIYMAIEYGKDLFEPTIFNSLLKYKTALEYIYTLHLAVGIVEELKLNEKLWSKT
ncbi:MAG: DUF3137 domain-containing protein [Sulfurospirillaceae bacterium]|nr:DUF3137 domain-containing protein [Sulfurospirillaceae bacterium]